MTVLVEWTDYNLASPEFFVDHIKTAVNTRDIKSLMGERGIGSVMVSTSHPLVTLLGTALSGQDASKQSGILPRISVVEGPEPEGTRYMGQGTMVSGYADLTELNALKARYPGSTPQGMEERIKEALYTDDEIEKIKTYINWIANENGYQPGDVKLICNVEKWPVDQSVMIGLWAENIQQRQILGRLLRSVIFKMQQAMRLRNARAESIRSDYGLVNMNFGRVLHGQETEITFHNWFRNISITDEIVVDQDLDVLSDIDATVWDTPPGVTNDNSDDTTANTAVDWEARTADWE